jgi:hypothetical protein
VQEGAAPGDDPAFAGNATVSRDFSVELDGYVKTFTK